MVVRTLLVVLVAVLLAIGYSRSPAPAIAEAAEDAQSAPALFAPETKSDYITLADQYDDLAKDALAEAEKHRKMAASTKGGMKAAYRERMMKHCNEIVKLQERLAGQYGELAAAYRAQAAEME